MSVQAYDTVLRDPAQPAVADEAAWEREVIAHLPADWAAQARTLKAFQRARGLRDPADLLRGLLVYALGAGSFRSLGAWSVLIGLADIGETAWRKHLRTARAWLMWLLAEMLQADGVPAGTSSPRVAPGARLLLVDATTLCVPGGHGDDWRVHMAYDLLAARLGPLVVADRTSGEHLEHYPLVPGDIVVADRNYGYRRSVVHAHNHQAFVVLRIRADAFPLERPTGEPVDVLAWLKSCRGAMHECRLVCRDKDRCLPVRLLAVRLPADKAEQARRQAVQRAKRKGQQLRAETLYLAEWVLVITTLPETDWPMEAVLRLYRARWQIELVFKRLKQLIRLNTLRVKEPSAVEAVICLHLIAWALHEPEAAWIRAQLSEVHQHTREGAAVSARGVLSSWRVSALCLAMLRQTVVGRWDRQRLRECLPRLRRFLCESPRRRPHQQTTIYDWLEARLHGAEVLWKTAA